MQSTDLVTPLALQTPIAINGNKNIPSQTASGDDTSSIDAGFLPITSEAIDDGGVAPERVDFNGMFYLSTDQRVYLQCGGRITFDSNVSTAIGGYPQGAVLDYIDSNGNYSLVKSLIDDNTYNFVSTPSYIDGIHWEQIPLGGNSRNIGEIVASTIPLTDAGLHLLDGALLQYGSYKAFIDYIGDLYDSGNYTAIFDTEANWQSAVTTYGVCGKFVYDSVNNTVRLPKYSNKIYSSSITSTAPTKGNGKTLGLTDGTNTGGLASPSAGGLSAFTNAYDKNVGTIGVSSGNMISNCTFGVLADGTKSGLITDLSNITASLDGYYYIVIANTTKTQIQVDIDEIATDLNGKADVDLTNVNSSGTSKAAGWAMPSGTYDSVTVGASGATYQAPANGWFVCYGVGTNSCSLYINNQTTSYSDYRNGDNANGIAVVCPTLKNESVQMGWYNVNISFFRFIYASGSEWEA